MQMALLGSRRPGRSAWIPVPRGKGAEVFLRVSGMSDGDLVDVAFRPSHLSGDFEIRESGDYEIPKGTRHLAIEHVACSGSRVSVDIVRTNGDRAD